MPEKKARVQEQRTEIIRRIVAVAQLEKSLLFGHQKVYNQRVALCVSSDGCTGSPNSCGVVV
jgi:hypothetical protein